MANISVSGLEFDADLEQVFLFAGVWDGAAIEDLTPAQFSRTGPLHKNSNRDGLRRFNHRYVAIPLFQRDGDRLTVVTKDMKSSLFCQEEGHTALIAAQETNSSDSTSR